MKERQNEHHNIASLIQICALKNTKKNTNYSFNFDNLDFFSSMAAMWENLGDTEEASKWRRNLEDYVFYQSYRYQNYKEKGVGLELMESYLESFVSPASKLQGILRLLQDETYLELDGKIQDFLVIEGLVSAYAIEKQTDFEDLLPLLGGKGGRSYPFVRGEIERFDYLVSKKDFNSAANVLKKLVGWKQECDNDKLAGYYFWGIEIDVNSIDQAIDALIFHLSSKYPHIFFGSKDSEDDGVFVDFNHIDVLPDNLENMMIRPENKWLFQLNVLSFYCRENIQEDLDNLLDRMVNDIADDVGQDYKLAEIYNLLNLLPDDGKRNSLIWKYFGDGEDYKNFFVRISQVKPETALVLLDYMHMGLQSNGKSAGFDYSAVINRMDYLKDNKYNTEIKINALSSLVLASLCSAVNVADFVKKLNEPHIKDGIREICKINRQKYLHVIRKTAQSLMGRFDFEPSRKIELFNYLYGHLLKISGGREILGSFILYTARYAARVNNSKLLGEVLHKVQEIDSDSAEGKYLTIKTISQAARSIADL